MGRRVVTKKDVVAELRAFSVPIGEVKEKVITKPEIDDYKLKLVKYIPAEIVAAYITIDGIVKSATGQISETVFWIIFFILLVLTPLWIWRVTTEPGKPKAMKQIIISTISFAIWVFALGGPFVLLSWYKPVYGALLLPIYTVVVPILEK